MHLARDHDRSLIAAHVRDGEWIRIRPGAYLDAGFPGTDRELALARIAAVGSRLTTEHVVSHTSAAVLWGLPTLRPPARTHVIQATGARVGASPDVVRHLHVLDPADTTVLHGTRVTSLERTVVDCAMSEPVLGGVVVADAALHRGARAERCTELVSTMAGRRGVVRARTVLELADDGAESAGESLARVALLRAGLPRPETQVPVDTRLGTFWADLGWSGHRLLVEYDGRGKYADATLDVVLAEKRREDALLDAGWRLLRLTAEDLRSAEALARRLRHLLPGAPLTPRPMLAR